MTASLLLNNQMLIGCDLFLLTFGEGRRCWLSCKFLIKSNVFSSIFLGLINAI